MRARCSQNQSCFDDFASKMMVCGWFGTSPVKPIGLSLWNVSDAKAAQAPPQVPGSQVAELSSCVGNCSVTKAAHTKVLHADFSPKPHFTEQWQQTLWLTEAN